MEEDSGDEASNLPMVMQLATGEAGIRTQTGDST